MLNADRRLATPQRPSPTLRLVAREPQQSACAEVRTALTVMFGAYQLARHTGSELDRSTRRHLLARAEHHAKRAESLLKMVSESLGAP